MRPARETPGEVRTGREKVEVPVTGRPALKARAFGVARLLASPQLPSMLYRAATKRGGD